MRILLTALLALLLSVPAQAAFVDGQNAKTMGGFSGSGQNNECTVKQAKNMRDDSPVTLTGKIVQRIKGDKYLFRDATGEITIDIDDEDFRGLTVTPDNTVRIYGEVDKDFGRNSEIDVKSLQILQ